MLKINGKFLILACLLVFSFAVFSPNIEATTPLFTFDGEENLAIGSGDISIGSSTSPINSIIISAKNSSDLKLSTDIKNIYSSSNNVFHIENSKFEIAHSLTITQTNSAFQGAIQAKAIDSNNTSLITLGNNIKLILSVSEVNGTHGFYATFDSSSPILDVDNAKAKISAGNNLRIEIAGGSGHSVLYASSPYMADFDNSQSIIEVGNNAYFSITNGHPSGGFSSAIATDSRYDNEATKITIGEDATIIVKDNSNKARGSTGIKASGGTIVLGKNASITVDVSAVSALETYEAKDYESYVIYLSHGADIQFLGKATLKAIGPRTSVFYFSAPANKVFSFEDITAASENGTLIYNQGANGIALSFSGNSSLIGDIIGGDRYGNYINGNSISLSLSDNSTWSGSSINTTSTLNLDNSSAWLIEKDSTITNLNMLSAESKIVFRGNDYHTATIGNLSASKGGLVEMRAYASTDPGDLLIIEDGSGILYLNFSATAGSAERSESIVKAPENDVTIIAPNEVGIGSRIYTLESDTDSFNVTSYYLQRTDDPNPVVGKISSGSIGMIQAAKALDDIITFEGIKKIHGFFIHGHYKHQIYDELTFNFNSEEYTTISFNQNIGGGIIGYNWGINNNILLGAFIGGSSTKQSFEDSSNSQIRILTGGIQGMIDIKNFDLHAYVRISHNTQTSELLTPQEDYRYGNTSAMGLGMSVSLSYPIKFEEIKLTVTPVGRIFFSHIGKHDFYVYNNVSTTPEMELYLAAESGFQTWLGANVNKTFDLSNGMGIDVHASAGWVFNEGDAVAISINGDDFMANVDRHLLSLNIGADLNVGLDAINHVFIDFNFMIGKTMKEVFGVKLGGSWEF